MPNKKKKYNSRFPPARIKRIIQQDDDVGKVAAAVPVIISRALELFIESLIRNASKITRARNAKTLTTTHLKQCILAENKFDFLKDLVASVPDVQPDDDVSNPTPLPPTFAAAKSTAVTHKYKRVNRARKLSRANVDEDEEDDEDEDEDDDDEDDEESDEDEDESRSEDSLPATKISLEHRGISTTAAGDGKPLAVSAASHINGTQQTTPVVGHAFGFTAAALRSMSELDEDYDS